MLSDAVMLELFLERDPGGDGKFLVGVKSTGVYCLPSCPARRPKIENIRFFRQEDAARADGYRPCRRCRPDLYTSGVDRDLDAVCELVRRCREHPERFPGVEELARSGGVGTTKLSALFREHLHATPNQVLNRFRISRARELLSLGERSLEVAFAVGYESSSTYHENFRRWTGMRPGEYAKLGQTRDFRLLTPAGYAPQYALRLHGRDPESVCERVTRSRIEKVLTLDSLPVVLSLEIGEGEVFCTLQCSEALTRQAFVEASEVGHRMLGLRSDPAEFRAHLARCAAHSGTPFKPDTDLRIPLAASNFESLVWAISGQQVNVPFAATLRRRLCRLCGRDMGGGRYTHPTPDEFAHIDYADLTQLQFSRRKAEYLIDCARTVCSGELPLQDFDEFTFTEAESLLLRQRGLGPWSAHYVLMRGAGFADCVPLGDVGLAEALRKVYGLPVRPGNEGVLDLLKPFRPFRSMATFGFWNLLSAGL